MIPRLRAKINLFILLSHVRINLITALFTIDLCDGIRRFNTVAGTSMVNLLLEELFTKFVQSSSTLLQKSDV